jgi:hypothetical protein
LVSPQEELTSGHVRIHQVIIIDSSYQMGAVSLEIAGIYFLVSSLFWFRSPLRNLRTRVGIIGIYSFVVRTKLMIYYLCELALSLFYSHSTHRHPGSAFSLCVGSKRDGSHHMEHVSERPIKVIIASQNRNSSVKELGRFDYNCRRGVLQAVALCPTLIRLTRSLHSLYHHSNLLYVEMSRERLY